MYTYVRVCMCLVVGVYVVLVCVLLIMCVHACGRAYVRACVMHVCVFIGIIHVIEFNLY